jgi:hypothetical protein
VYGNCACLGSGTFDFDFRVERHVRHLAAVRERHEDIRAGPRGDIER